MTIFWVLAGVVAVVAVASFFWFARREVSQWIKDQISQSLRFATDDFLKLASERLGKERTQQLGDLEVRKKEVERVVQGLEKQLVKHEQLIKDLERDRAQKYGSLEQQLAQTAAETQKLHTTTTQLAAVLGNVKLRGQWGERTADDILRLCGLREHTHYEKQKNAPLGRPDFTFLLPDGHRCYMDVKFPLDNYLKWANCERDEERKSYKDQFLKDVRGHMKELELRDYAPSQEDAPDYVMMFIPNEQVYNLLNEWMPGLIDESLSKRIILCGPTSLYATIRLMWQAWQNYYHAETIGEIKKTVIEFQKAYEGFKGRFEELGKKLKDAAGHYDDITQKNYAQLDRKIQQIERYQKGEGVDARSPLEAVETRPMQELTHD